MAGKVENMHILITGATSGLGYAMAEALLAEGAIVAIASRSAEKLLRERCSGRVVAMPLLTCPP